VCGETTVKGKALGDATRTTSFSGAAPTHDSPKAALRLRKLGVL
jgi:hypothetical protein